MNTINLTFLGQAYALPGDILSYIEYQQFFSLLRQGLLSFMLDHFGDCEKWPSLNLATDQFRKTADQCVKWLCEQGIYDKTVDDFIENNEGYQLYEAAVKETLLKSADIFMTYLKDLQADMVTAEQAAASNITGMGFSVYSSNIIDLAVFAAMEHNALKKQSIAADVQYNAMVNEARRRGQSSADKQTATLNAEYWLPKMNEAITVFIASLFHKFIDYLIAAHKFDAATRNYLDIKRANLIIQNIDSAADKQQLIREAFIKCPFCEEVYGAVVKMGLFTRDECHAAKTFQLIDRIEADTHTAAERICMDMSMQEEAVISKLAPYANASAIIHNSSASAITEQYLSRRRKKKLLELQRLEKTSGQSCAFDRIMREAFAEKMEDIFRILRSGKSTNDTLVSKLSLYIDRVALHNDASEYYNIHKQKTLEALVANARAYIQEAVTRYNAYKESADAYTKLNAEVNLKIASLQDERQKLGVFALSRKKSIDLEIAALQEGAAQSKQAMRQARMFWEKMYQR